MGMHVCGLTYEQSCISVQLLHASILGNICNICMYKCAYQMYYDILY